MDVAEETEDEEQARALFDACKVFMRAALREEGMINVGMQRRPDAR